MKKIYTLVILLTGIWGAARAQLLPANQPEQNACGALVLCGNSFFTPYSYQGNGTITDLYSCACDATGINAGEDNSVWIKVVISGSGTLVFTITPQLQQDDYDFAVLNATNVNCNNLSSANVVRCNFNQNVPVTNGGVVGLSTGSNQTSVIAGTPGQNFVSAINAQAGETYLIMINNFGVNGGPSSGFTINFAGSTATFFDSGNPAFQNIQNPPCNNRNMIRLNLSEEVKCSSIALNGSDFYLSPSGTIAAAAGVNCSGANGYTDQVMITFSSPLPPGNYTLHAQQGTDGNTLLDLCDNPLLLPSQINFVVPVLKDTVFMTKCTAELPFVWNGINVTSGGVTAATYTTQTAAGCDSITILNLTVTPTLNATVNLTKCAEDMPFVWNGITVNSGGNGVAQYATTSVGGCDSITVLNLTVVQPVFTTQNITICVNQLPYVWNGITVNNGGSAVATFNTNSAIGCDSTVTLNLTVTPIKEAVQSITVCENDLPMLWNNITIPEGSQSDDSVAQYMTQTASGCDSLTYLNLTVIPVNPLVIDFDTSGCGEVIFNGVTYTNNAVVADTLLNQYGCDSVYRTTYITVHINEPYFVQVDANGCGEVNFEGNTYVRDTLLIDTFTNIYGCDSAIRHVVVYVEDFELSLSASADTIAQGEYVVLNSTANVDYHTISWSPVYLFPDQSEKSQTFKPDETHNYQLIAESDIGCRDTAELLVYVDTLIPEVLMPNAFSPNGDGLNDEFLPVTYNKTGFVVEQFVIFNRWGNKVFETEGKSKVGWNGLYGNVGKEAEEGVYNYLISVKFVNGKVVIQKGDVTLLR